MKTLKMFYFIAVLNMAMTFAGCGSNSVSSSGGGNTVSVQMGGAIQGKPLSLNRTVTTIAGGYGSSDGSGAAARFKSPHGVTTDGTNLYVADSENFTIRKIVIATGAVTTLAGTPGISGWTDGVGASARFFTLMGITTDGANLYVVDSQTIRKVVIATGAVTTLAGTQLGSSGSADGFGAAATFRNPMDITTDGTNLYVADSQNYTIRKIVIATGEVTTLAGTAGTIGWTDGVGATARFASPVGITTDGPNLYVADLSTIRKVVIATREVTTLAGKTGTINSIGSTDGAGLDARFYGPWGITTDGTNLYVTEYYNNTIRKIVIATGIVSTVAGTAGNIGPADGVGAAASFWGPINISTDGTSLYVADTGNNSIRKIQ